MVAEIFALPCSALHSFSSNITVASVVAIFLLSSSSCLGSPLLQLQLQLLQLLRLLLHTTRPSTKKYNHVQGIISSVFLPPFSSLRCCAPDAAACAVAENHKVSLNLAGF